MEEKKKTLTELEKEKELDPEEIIEFEYYDRINKKKVIIKDKRKIKTALDEMDKYEKKQKDLIQKYECPLRKEDEDNFVYEQNQFEEDLESAFQEVVDQISQKEQNSQKNKNYLKKHIASLTEKQIIVLFLHNYLDFNFLEISQILNTTKQRISQLHKRIKKKLALKDGLGGWPKVLI